MMRCEIRPYRHYGNCIVVDNGVVEAILSLCFGPRILSFRLHGCENVFYEQPADADYLRTDEGWRVYAGTRLWFAPEGVHNVYEPDNAPVEYAILPEGVRVTQAWDAALEIEKSIVLRFAANPNGVTVEYAVRNLGAKPLFGAPWAVSMMAEGAEVTAPFGCESFGATPLRQLSLWNNTSLADPRLDFRQDGIRILHTPPEGRPFDRDAYFKLGILCRAGDASCKVRGQVFTKTFDGSPGGAFPDGNVNLEIYCCRHMLEFETLAKEGCIPPGETAVHTENWRLRKQEEGMD